MRINVGRAEDIRREGCRAVQVEGHPVLVVSVDDQFFAFHDRCPHMGAPLSAGSVSGTMLPSSPQELDYGKDGRVLRCPWHGWEFDLITGRSLLEPRRVGIRTYRVAQEDGQLVVYVGRPDDDAGCWECAPPR